MRMILSSWRNNLASASFSHADTSISKLCAKYSAVPVITRGSHLFEKLNILRKAHLEEHASNSIRQMRQLDEAYHESIGRMKQV